MANALTDTGSDTATNFDLGNFEKLLERQVKIQLIHQKIRQALE